MEQKIEAQLPEEKQEIKAPLDQNEVIAFDMGSDSVRINAIRYSGKIHAPRHLVKAIQELLGKHHNDI